MADFSCSQLKHASLGKSITNKLPLQHIVKPGKLLDLPQVNSTDIVIGQSHKCDERSVQGFTNKWLSGKAICGKYWVHDAHNRNDAFLGRNLKPDFFVSTENKFPYGEVCVVFLIDVFC